QVPADPAPVDAAVYYANCAAARAAGAAPLRAGRPGYREQMDGDRDGVACE
uniref:excalibur calcium-binding domain-containing protein n=1 Tax=Arthrobacter sp. TB 26 TaxID=494420 RepID=UPI0004A490CB